MTADSPIEVYLDELLTASAGMAPRQVRALLAEAEAHLRDDAAAAVAAGMSEPEAERLAVTRFGLARVVARADRERSTLPLLALARQATSSAVLLGAVGAVAVGLSGLLALVMRLAAGARFVVGEPSADALRPASCARWLGANPHAGSCAAAAMADWADDTSGYRIAAGLLGLLVLLVHRRLWHGERRTRSMLPRPVGDTIAFTAFLGAGMGTLVLGLNAVATASGDGSGQWLSAAAVALAAAAWCGLRLARLVRHTVTG